jgi:hypothetical protein
VVGTPQAAPSAPAPVPAPSQTSTTPSQKTTKECVAERRADKAGMQARGVTQKAYVEQCRAGDAAPSAATPEPKPTVAAPAPAPAPAPVPAPAPSRAAPAATENRSSSCAAKISTHDDCRTDAVSGAAALRTEKHSNAGGRSVRGRGVSESALPDRHHRVGQFVLEDLSLRGNEELWDHKTRCLHVRKGSHRN